MHVKVRAKVRAPIHQAWARLADLKALAAWGPGVAGCRAEPLRLGARRVVTLTEPAYGKAQLVETVNALRPQGFTYDIEGGIGPLGTIVTSWDLESKGDAGGACVVVVASDVTLEGRTRFAKPLAWMAWRRQLKQLAKAFATYAAE